MNPVIEKIKKLLRMKNGGTAAEIATALRLAQELAQKHNIDMGSIDPDQYDDGKIAHEEIILGSRVQWECKYAALICVNFFHVNCLFHHLMLKNCIAFIGTRKDIEISRYIYVFVVRSMRLLWKNKRSRSRNRRAFLYGIFLGICSNLREQKTEHENKEGLIVINRGLRQRNDYMAKHFGATTDHDLRPDTRAHHSIENGWRAGKDIAIRYGLNSPAKNKQIT